MIFLASNSSGPNHGLGGEDGRVLGRVCPQVEFPVFFFSVHGKWGGTVTNVSGTGDMYRGYFL